MSGKKKSRGSPMQSGYSDRTYDGEYDQSYQQEMGEYYPDYGPQGDPLMRRGY
eukprot:CAMPEP_0117573068 /NCGR_PEP_ID=MMETSP0784-20121206/60732_1 /TAXON_ID=39447 /ORGANISM="" /LENGTH=52 /DNA_ID=CAMNT_0005371559 /DNA_START=8 /DNA_END=166 /DNA_ORIENTATION=+